MNAMNYPTMESLREHCLSIAAHIWNDDEASAALASALAQTADDRRRSCAPTLVDLRQANACVEGYKFYRLSGRDPVCLADAHPEWYLWMAGKISGDWLDHELLDRCAERRPAEAQLYAEHLLTQERRDWLPEHLTGCSAPKEKAG